MNKYILLIILIVCSSFIFATTYDNTFNITGLPICEDDTTVKISSENLITEGDIRIINCDETNSSNYTSDWNCPCDRVINNTITAGYINGTNNLYDFIVIYNVESLNDIYKKNYSESRLQIEYDNRQRTLRFYNIQIGKPTPKISGFTQLLNGLQQDKTAFNTTMTAISIVVCIIIILFGVAIYIIAKEWKKE